MKNMEEIAYWVQTKRAPCLFKFDNANKKQNNEAQCSKFKSVDMHTQSKEIVAPSPKKKKKRKLSILDESDSEHKEENLFFENTPRHIYKTVLSSCKDSIISESNLNVKKTSLQDKTKINKLQKNIRQNPQKKFKIMSSTPKVTVNNKRNVKSNEKIRNLDSSLESGLFSGETKNKQSSISKTISKKSGEKFAAGDIIQNKSKPETIVNRNGGVNVVNGIFDDISDVSGFTANYIRSTKKDRSKNSKCQSKKISRRLIKESQDTTERKHNSNFMVCVNKSVNTTHNTDDHLNCSTDSYNVINLISMETSKPELNSDVRIDKSTSLLKFLDPNIKTPQKVNDNKKVNKNSKKVLDTSFQSKSSVTSRYFTRSKVSSMEDMSIFKIDQTSTSNKVSSTRRRAVQDKITMSNNNCTMKESLTNFSTKSRGRRKTMDKSKNSVLVVNNLTEPISSSVSMNVADNVKTRKRWTKNDLKNHTTSKSELCSSNPKNKSGLSVAREKSGFAICFSDSDDEKPSKEHKFFT